MIFPADRCALILMVSLSTNAALAGSTLNSEFPSLEDLMDVEVTSVSKKAQRLANVAAAVHVISAEDIHLSGATTLPEALRLAPGIDATQISGNRWGVSARGFADRLSNKMLVLVDGRSAYSPAFSGVLWEDLQFPLEDVERIEVLRGPAAVIWGTNGINGVINIITKSAAATQGGQLTAGVGNTAGGFGRMRWGGKNENGDIFYRVYGTTQDANSSKNIDGSHATDNYTTHSAGFRIDNYLSNGAHLDASGDYYSSNSNLGTLFAQPGLPNVRPDTEKHHGISLRTRYDLPLAVGGLQIQGAYVNTQTTEGSITADKRQTIDLDAQHRFTLAENHDIIWGGSYRWTSDTISPTAYFRMDDTSRHTQLFGLFAQDEIRFAEHWLLTLGARADHNDFSGWEIQPDLRLAWNLANNHTLWSSLSQVSRAPSRGEVGMNTRYNQGSVNVPFSGSVPLVLNVHSNDRQPDELTALQLGWRSQWTPALSSDTVIFQNRYKHLYNTTNMRVVPHATLPFGLINYVDVYLDGEKNASMTMNGAEWSIDWRPVSTWHLQWVNTLQRVVDTNTEGESRRGDTPRLISSLRTSWAPLSTVNLDLWLRHTGRRGDADSATGTNRHSFSSVDLRLAWRPINRLELSLTGQNLNDGTCDAYSGILMPEATPKLVPTCQPRTVVGQLRLDF